MNMKERVEEFRKAFDASDDPELWRKLVAEETEEVGEAIEHLLKEIADLYYVTAGYMNVTGEQSVDVKAKELIGAMTNELACRFEYMIPEEVLKAVFEEVHRSNMSKLGKDGKPIRREDGKILKGPNYSPADIKKVLKEFDNASD